MWREGKQRKKKQVWEVRRKEKEKGMGGEKESERKKYGKQQVLEKEKGMGKKEKQVWEVRKNLE